MKEHILQFYLESMFGPCSHSGEDIKKAKSSEIDLMYNS